jgi:hypothetical protein
MSLDLSVPMSGGLDARALVKLAADYYRDLLGLPFNISLQCIELRAGRRIAQPPIAIDVGCGYLLADVSDPDVLVEVTALIGAFDLADRFPCATAVFGVSVRASEDEPRRLALGAAAAAAAACLCGSKVYDDTRDWTEKELSDPREFVEALRAPSAVQSADEATRDFRARMWNRGRR